MLRLVFRSRTRSNRDERVDESRHQSLAGLAGFALFLIFVYLGKVMRSRDRRWVAPIFICLAAAALTCGLAIAYVQVAKTAQPSAQTSQPRAPAKQQSNQQVQQTSTGEGSPNVQGVQGDVNITVDQSTGKTDTKKATEKKPKPASQ